MVVRTFGTLILSDGNWLISDAEPHVCIKLKAIFLKIEKNKTGTFKFKNTNENCSDLLWFIDRYPLTISDNDLNVLKRNKKKHIQTINELERILIPDYIPTVINLKNGFIARDYQTRGRDVFFLKERLLCGDDMGLGKTLIAIISFIERNLRPALVVCQTHLTNQWKSEIEKYTDLKVEIITKNKAYSLKKADVYISTYSRLSGWVDVFQNGFINCVVFDEAQELRRRESMKYEAAKSISKNVKYVLALSGTPIYNYGDEIWNVLNVINPGCLGTLDDFMREWTKYSKNVTDPKALGTYLREQFLLLRRTRADVGRELPPVNKIIQTVEFNYSKVEENNELTKQLALKVMTGSFMERGQAGRELDMMMRRDTGIGKAAGVAHYVRMLLENGEPVVLAGWHRAVYEIWLEMLADFNPVMYTGSESIKQKDDAVKKFINGETNLFIISLRSGIGLDGLQKRCNIVAIGELDYSPKVHEQLIARVDRDQQQIAVDRDQRQVTAIFLVAEEGSDPPIIDILGLKNSQSHSIMNPLSAIESSHSDDSRIKLLALNYLKKHNIQLPLINDEQTI